MSLVVLVAASSTPVSATIVASPVSASSVTITTVASSTIAIAAVLVVPRRQAAWDDGVAVSTLVAVSQLCSLVRVAHVVSIARVVQVLIYAVLALAGAQDVVGVGGVVNALHVAVEGIFVVEILLLLRHGAHVVDESLGLAGREVTLATICQRRVGVVVIIGELFALGNFNVDARRLDERLFTVASTTFAATPTAAITTTTALAVLVSPRVVVAIVVVRLVRWHLHDEREHAVLVRSVRIWVVEECGGDHFVAHGFLLSGDASGTRSGDRDAHATVDEHLVNFGLAVRVVRGARRLSSVALGNSARGPHHEHTIVFVGNAWHNFVHDGLFARPRKIAVVASATPRRS
jgi:hypothetical protein